MLWRPTCWKLVRTSAKADTETNNATIWWDYSIQTDRKIKLNKSDITVIDKREKTYKLVDVKILAEKNVSVAEFEKVSKYKDLEIEVEKLWHMKTVTIPVVIGVLDMIKTGNEKHLQKIPWSPNLAEMPKNSPYRQCSYPKTNLISVKTNKTMNNWNNVESLYVLNIYSKGSWFESGP